MRYGIVVPQHEVSPQEAIAAALLAEESGLDSVWLIDHLQGHLRGRPAATRPVLECWTLLSAIAASTSRVTVGTLVTRAGLRPPLVTAHMARTVADISSGRLIVGVGIGDPSNREEQLAYGLGYPPRHRRIAVAEETIEAVKRVAGVPVLVGGASDAALALAKQAGGLNVWVGWERSLDARRRFAASAPGLPASWAGSWPGERMSELQAAGFDEIIISTGGGNYRDRIASLASSSTPFRH